MKHHRPPTRIEMPLVSPEVGKDFFAKRKVPKSDAPPLKAVATPRSDLPALEQVPQLLHDLPESDTTPSGRKRADFAIRRKAPDTLGGQAGPQK